MWTKFLAGLVAFLSMVAGYFAWKAGAEKAERLEDELGDEQAARAIEGAAHRSMVDSLTKENKNAAKDTPTDRGRFT